MSDGETPLFEVFCGGGTLLQKGLLPHPLKLLLYLYVGMVKKEAKGRVFQSERLARGGSREGTWACAEEHACVTGQGGVQASPIRAACPCLYGRDKIILPVNYVYLTEFIVYYELSSRFLVIFLKKICPCKNGKWCGFPEAASAKPQ